MKLLIIGGLGDFGRFYAKKFKENGFDVFLSSRDEELGKKVCEENGYGFSNDPSDFDVVVLSVPNQIAPKIAAQTIPKMKKGALFIDFCSVKTLIFAEEKKFVNNGVEILSIHPMHGPRVPNLLGYPVVFIPIEEREKSVIIREFFSDQGAKIIESNPEEHDKILSVVQGLTHYSQFVCAAVLRELGYDIKETMKFSSPNYSLFLSLLSRVVLQNPELYCQIQVENPYNREIRALFTKNSEVLEKLCNSNSCGLLQKEILLDGHAFKDPEVMLLESDRAVNALKYMVNTLSAHLGGKFLVENVITKSFHYGVLVKAGADEIVLNEGRNNVVIATPKIRLTTKEEMRLWKEKNLSQRYLDFSFIVPAECDPKIIKLAFSTIREVKFDMIDEYAGDKLPKGMKSVTFRANFFTDDNAEKINANIVEIIDGLGFKLR